LYDNEIVGGFIADIVVKVQMVNYLVATGKPAGLIIDFGERKVEIKHKAKDLTAD